MPLSQQYFICLYYRQAICITTVIAPAANLAGQYLESPLPRTLSLKSLHALIEVVG